MRRKTFLRMLVAAAMASGPAAQAQTQDFPTKQITIVFPGPAGGEPDRIARTIAEKLREKWGQPVIVENRAGAGGNIGAEYVSRANPDGHTLLFTGVGSLALGKFIYSKLGYDPETFVPVSLVVVTPLVLVTHPKVPVQNLRELVSYAKTNPNRLNYGSAGNGTTTHLTGELFKSMSGAQIVHIPYKGLAPALQDLIGEQLQMLVMDIGSALPHIRAGKVRAIAVTTQDRSPLLPEVPAVAEAVPGFSSAFAFAVVAPPNTPPAVAAKLSAAIAEGMKQPEVARRLLDAGTQVVAGTPAEMAATMVQERRRWGDIVRSLNIKVD